MFPAPLVWTCSLLLIVVSLKSPRGETVTVEFAAMYSVSNTVPVVSSVKLTVRALPTETIRSVMTSFCPVVGTGVTLATAADWSALVKRALEVRPREDVPRIATAIRPK